jgi:type I restriction enzyme S subunit
VIRGWTEVPLGEIVTDLTKNRTRVIEPEGLVIEPTIRTKEHKIDVAAVRIGVEVKIKARVAILPGDLVFSRLHTQNGGFAFADREFLATGTFMPLAVDESKVDRRFLFWALHVRVPSISATSDSVGRETYKSEHILAIPVPLPPMEQQRRTVAKIGALSAMAEKAHALREQAVEEAEAFINSQLREAFSSFDKRYGTTSLGDLITGAGYGSSEKCDSERIEGAVPVLRIPNVVSEQIKLTDLKYAILSAHDQDRLMLAKGDVLVVRTNGSLNLVGRSAVVDELPEPMAFASYMIRLRLDQERILPEYAQRTLRHLRMAGRLVDFARTTAGQYNVSLGRLRSARIPVPPLSEQYGFVGKLDALQTEADALKCLQSQTATELDALMPSILDKAFKGEL